MSGNTLAWCRTASACCTGWSGTQSASLALNSELSCFNTPFIPPLHPHSLHSMSACRPAWPSQHHHHNSSSGHLVSAPFCLQCVRVLQRSCRPAGHLQRCHPVRAARAAAAGRRQLGLLAGSGGAGAWARAVSVPCSTEQCATATLLQCHRGRTAKLASLKARNWVG